MRRLRIYAHALRERNAYYSPDKKALLFGYFPAGMLGAELSLRVILALRGPQRGRAGAGEAAWARIPAIKLWTRPHQAILPPLGGVNNSTVASNTQIRNQSPGRLSGSEDCRSSTKSSRGKPVAWCPGRQRGCPFVPFSRKNDYNSTFSEILSAAFSSVSR